MSSINLLKKVSFLLVISAYALVVIWLSPEIIPIINKAAPFFLLLVVLAILGVVGQAKSFALMLPENFEKKLSGIAGVWSLSSLANYIIPFAPSIAFRHLYFYKNGISHGALLETTISWLVGSLYVCFVFASTAFVGFRYGVHAILIVLIFFFLVSELLRKLLFGINDSLAKKITKTAILPFVRGVRLPAMDILLYSAIQYFVTSSSYFVALKACGVDANIYLVAIISCGALFLTMFPLMPNGLGISDSILGGFAFSHGGSAEVAVSIVLLLRLANFMGCLLLVIFLRPKSMILQRERKY